MGTFYGAGMLIMLIVLQVFLGLAGGLCGIAKCSTDEPAVGLPNQEF